MQQSNKNISLTPKNKSQNSTVKIIGGEMRGRKLHFTSIDGLRPTLNRVRETLFNWLTKNIQGAHCLDLFAGSGALGFEAISRGAASVTMVERNLNVSKNLHKNAQRLKVEDRLNIITTASAKYLRENNTRFDVVFLDPPFGQGLLEITLNALKNHLTASAVVYLERENSSTNTQPSSEWQPLKYKKAANFSYALYKLINTEK